MIIEYISKYGNLEKTEDVIVIPENLEKIGSVWFEKREEVKEEKKETKKEEKKEDTAELEERAKAFCKEKKIKGFGLLKGQKIIDKAIENGFII